MQKKKLIEKDRKEIKQKKRPKSRQLKKKN